MLNFSQSVISNKVSVIYFNKHCHQCMVFFISSCTKLLHCTVADPGFTRCDEWDELPRTYSFFSPSLPFSLRPLFYVRVSTITVL